MRPRSYLLAFIASLSVAAVLAACQPGNRYANPDHSNIKQAEPPEMISEGIKADYRIANELNKIPGLQGAAVLIHNGEAYVGAHVIGDEKTPDAYMKKPFGSYYPNGENAFSGEDNRSRLSGKGIPQTNSYGSPTTDNNGVTQSGENVSSIPNKADVAQPNTLSAPDPDKVGSATGNVEPELVRQIQDKVKSMAPDVRTVHFTGKNEHVAQLQGYARYIQDGGSMQPFASDFDKAVKRIWSNAKPE